MTSSTPQAPSAQSTPLFVGFPDSELNIDLTDRKVANLHAAMRDGLPVPPWFVILPDAILSGMSPNLQDEFRRSREAAKVKYFIQRLQPAPRLIEEVQEAVNHLIGHDTDSYLALRPSLPTRADSASGVVPKLDPFLYVKADDVVARLIEIWQLYYNEDMLYERARHGQPLIEQPPAIIVQKMVHADVSGVAFGGDPVTGRRGIVVIAAVYGLGTSMLSGESDADAYEVTREGEVIRRDIAVKQTAHILDQVAGFGVRSRMVMPSQQGFAALTDSKAKEIADLTWRVSTLSQAPRQIAWALEAGEIWILETGRVPGLERLADPDAQAIRWDRRGIGAAYPGISTPLSYAVARWIYRGAYQELCRALGVSETEIRGRTDLFDGIVGTLSGALYLNATRLREMLDILPQPHWHREQLAQSLGLLDDPGAAQPTVNRSKSSEDDDVLHLNTLGVSKMLYTIQTRASRYEQTKTAFEKRLEEVLKREKTPLDRQRPDELASTLRRLQRDLIDRWDAPAANEALSAIAYDLLGQLTKNWCEDTSGALQRHLVADLDDLPGTDAARRIDLMVKEIEHSPDLLDTLLTGGGGAISTLVSAPESQNLRKAVDDYLDLYGDVSPDGLKIEAQPLVDSPLPLFREIGRMARTDGDSPSAALLPTRAITALDKRISSQAQEKVDALLSDRSARRRLFKPVQDLARKHLSDAEQYKFDQIRVVALIRTTVMELGRRFYAMDVIDSPRHILYLELEEILGFIEGTTSTADLRGLVAIRFREHAERARTNADPPKTLTTHGVANTAQNLR